MSRRMASVLVMAMLIAPLCMAQQRGPSTPQERAAVVEVAKKLQDNPLDVSLQPERDRLVMAVVESPDLNQVTCGDEMPWLKGKYRYTNELSLIHLLSTTAYMITNGPKADEKAAHLAGLEGAIKAYQAIVRQNPKQKWQPMEDLAARFGSGDLAKAAPGFCKRS